jgi:hypothetical protein
MHSSPAVAQQEHGSFLSHFFLRCRQLVQDRSLLTLYLDSDDGYEQSRLLLVQTLHDGSVLSHWIFFLRHAVHEWDLFLVDSVDILMNDIVSQCWGSGCEEKLRPDDGVGHQHRVSASPPLPAPLVGFKSWCCTGLNHEPW